jgi:hypothetical protein
MTDDERLLEELKELKNKGVLTRWELDFVDNLIAIKRLGGTLSSKQYLKAMEILNVRTE